MTKPKKKDKKKRSVRSVEKRIEVLRGKIAEIEAEEAFKEFKNAIKIGVIAKKNVKPYRKLLRHLKVMKPAKAAFLDFEMNNEAEAAEKLRGKILEKLKALQSSDGKPTKTTPEWKSLIDEGSRLMDEYRASPGKSRLKNLFKHLDKMEESRSQNVQTARIALLKDARKEAKKLGLKL